MFNNLQEILQSHPFLMSQKFETNSYQRHGIKRIKSIFADRGMRLGASLYCFIASGSHFFNKTNFEQYLFTADRVMLKKFRKPQNIDGLNLTTKFISSYCPFFAVGVTLDEYSRVGWAGKTCPLFG